MTSSYADGWCMLLTVLSAPSLTSTAEGPGESGCVITFYESTGRDEFRLRGAGFCEFLISTSAAVGYNIPDTIDDLQHLPNLVSPPSQTIRSVSQNLFPAASLC